MSIIPSGELVLISSDDGQWLGRAKAELNPEELREEYQKENPNQKEQNAFDPKVFFEWLCNNNFAERLPYYDLYVSRFGNWSGVIRTPEEPQTISVEIDW